MSQKCSSELLSHPCLHHVICKCHFQKKTQAGRVFSLYETFPKGTSLFRHICEMPSGYSQRPSIILTEWFLGCCCLWTEAILHRLNHPIAEANAPLWTYLTAKPRNGCKFPAFMSANVMFLAFYSPPFARGSLSVKYWNTSLVPAAAAVAALLLL